MKLSKTASGRSLQISRSEWLKIGDRKGWTKSAYIQNMLNTPPSNVLPEIIKVLQAAVPALRQALAGVDPMYASQSKVNGDALKPCNQEPFRR